jgi:acetoin utilization deacetylase AcuC-like enzyme
MACHVRDMAATLGVPVGAVLEGGYNFRALTECMMATIVAMAGVGTAASIAPDPFVTSRADAHIGHYWAL